LSLSNGEISCGWNLPFIKWCRLSQYLAYIFHDVSMAEKLLITVILLVIILQTRHVVKLGGLEKGILNKRMLSTQNRNREDLPDYKNFVF